MSKVEDFLTKAQEQKIVEAIKSAELHTSGEIRVHIENSHSKTPIERAAEVFYQLKMDETQQKNGVLFYLAVQDKNFAVIGDENINSKVPANFWESIRNEVIREFKTAHFTIGLVKGISIVGKELKNHFPYKKDDVNELPDEISVE